MLLDKFIDIKLNGKTIQKYRDKGYEGIPQQVITVKIEDLIPTSHYKVRCQCSNCAKVVLNTYKAYVKYLENQSMYVCKSCIGIKQRKTSLKRYGAEHHNQTDEGKRIRKNTNLERYGVETYFLTEEFLSSSLIREKVFEAHVKSGRWISKEKKEEFRKFTRRCRSRTYRIKSIVYANWNGYDYYDGEYIKHHLDLHYMHENYPVVDHKISIFFGFKNGISIDILCDVKNLVITKRKNNLKKQQYDHSEYETIPFNT